jgi:hypothetical protein
MLGLGGKVARGGFGDDNNNDDDTYRLVCINTYLRYRLNASNHQP